MCSQFRWFACSSFARSSCQQVRTGKERYPKQTKSWIIAKIGIPSDKYQKDWKLRLRRERYNFFTNFWSRTLVRRQVTLENCVYDCLSFFVVYNIMFIIIMFIILLLLYCLSYYSRKRDNRWQNVRRWNSICWPFPIFHSGWWILQFCVTRMPYSAWYEGEGQPHLPCTAKANVCKLFSK